MLEQTEWLLEHFYGCVQGLRIWITTKFLRSYYLHVKSYLAWIFSLQASSTRVIQELRRGRQYYRRHWVTPVCEIMLHA